MGKNKLSSGLINVVTYDTNSNISLNSGSNLLMSLSGSGTVTIPGNLVVLGGISGSTAESASYSLNADKIDNLDSTQLVLTSSFNSYTSSASSSLGSLSGSIATTTLNLSSSVSSSIGDLSGSVATTTSGLSSIIGNLSSSVATTTSNLSSSIATTTSGLGGRITTIEGNYATTGSNIFVGSQVITGSLYITNDMVVQGCSCLQNITASAVSIGTNTVVLNTATPAVRFAGISVQDSGSNAGVTGSIYWDGLCNRWIYSNPSNVGYSGGMILSGPRNLTTIGNETTLTCNYLAKSGGGDHLYDSCIQEVSGSVTIGGTLCSSGVMCAPTVITTNVNINTSTSTGANLIVKGYSDFWNTTNTLLRIQHNGCASTIQSYTGGSNGIISLNPDGGNVGIGIATPSTKLHVCGGSVYITNNPGTDGFVFGSNSSFVKYAYITSTNDGAQKVGLSFNTTCDAGTTNQERLKIISDTGYVGIGTSNPYSTLTVGSGDSTAIISPGGSNTHLTIKTLGASGAFRVYATGGSTGVLSTTESFRVDAGGNVGIGTISPSYQLDMVSGTTVNQRIRLQRGSDDTNQNMLLGWNNIVVTRHNVSIASAQTDFSIIQCGSDGARIPFSIGVGGQACFACNIIMNGNTLTSTGATGFTLKTATTGAWTALYGDTAGLYLGTNAGNWMYMNNSGVSTFYNTVCTPQLVVCKSYNANNLMLSVANSTMSVPFMTYDTAIIQADDVTTLKLIERNGGASDNQILTLSVGDGSTRISTNGPNPLQFFVGGSSGGCGYNGLGGKNAISIACSGISTFNYPVTMGSVGHYNNYLNTSGCFAIFCASQGAILYVTSMHNNGRSTAIVTYANGVTGGAYYSLIGQATPYGPAALSFGVCGNGWLYGYAQYGGPMDFYAISMNSNFVWAF